MSNLTILEKLVPLKGAMNFSNQKTGSNIVQEAIDEIKAQQAHIASLEEEKGLYKNTLMSLKVIDSKSSEGREMIDITLSKFNPIGISE